MPAYIISRPIVRDAARMKEYAVLATILVHRFGGRYIAMTNDVAALEGHYDGRRLVIIEFPSAEHLKSFWESSEYRDIKQLRWDAADNEIWMVPGLPISGTDTGSNPGDARGVAS